MSDDDNANISTKFRLSRGKQNIFIKKPKYFTFYHILTVFYIASIIFIGYYITLWMPCIYWQFRIFLFRILSRKVLNTGLKFFSIFFEKSLFWGEKGG